MKNVFNAIAVSFAIISTPALADGNDMTALTPAQSAQMKAEREAAQARYATTTADEKAALRKSAQQKRLADLNAMERSNQADDMGRYMSY